MTPGPAVAAAPLAPQPNVYTVMMVVAILALVGAVALCLWVLLSPLPAGYGLEPGDLFKTLGELK